ncbi:MAG: response regulator transcription factor [Chloroflexi bacterium]|nr:response regulator transcription factor [Chloroflexota bacterium]
MSESQLTLLLVDDDPMIVESLAPLLERSGFHVLLASNGDEALSKIQSHHPDVIVMDVLMPRMNGRETLRRMRKSNIWTPTILLTQVGEAAERATALEEGADDYLNKPFHSQELLARIHAVLRRARSAGQSLSSARRLASVDLILDRQSRRVFLADESLNLTPKAFSVLEYLMTHPDEAVSREELLRSVWGWEYPTGTRTVDTRINELRRALNDDAASPRFIQTLTGEGYIFIAPVKPAP